MRRAALGLLISLFAAGTVFAQQPAPNNPADFFERGMNALQGTGLSHNNQNAIELLRTAGQMGYVPAYTVVGYFYDTGTIVASEPGVAAEWYRKGVKEDDPLAEWLLGRLYYLGTGVPRDWTNAETFLTQAAGHEDPFGEYLLGSVKLEKQDYKNAADNFRKAAEQGLPQAQYQLGLMLKRGQGINEDKFEAYTWLLVSFDAGNQAASSDLSTLEADLGSMQLEKAKSKARDLEARVRRTAVAHGCTGWPGEFDAIPVPPPPDLQRFCR
jgi:uncharacterized protein